MKRNVLSVTWHLAWWGMAAPVLGQADWGSVELALDRIIPGWTNYSTAFNATHDLGVAGDYASVAAFYRPAGDVRLEELGVVVIGGGTRPPEFGRIQYRVMVWSGLEAFVREPRVGDVATWDLAAPTSGSVDVPDTWTRGGRAAYVLRFALTNRPVTLGAGGDWLVGFAARAETQTAGELYVPTSSDVGESDVQAGDLVLGGWRHLADAGGSTVYSGRLALSLAVRPRLERPRVEMVRAGRWVIISWPVDAVGYVLEQSGRIDPETAWNQVEQEPEEVAGRWQVVMRPEFTRQWFRLRR